MPDFTLEEKQEIYEAFNRDVNMPPKKLAQWLESDASRAVGSHEEGDSESVGHASGRQILEIKRTRKSDLSDAQYAHMRKVVGYIHRHLAQRPSGDITETPWRYSLMNWGHDPTK